MKGTPIHPIWSLDRGDWGPLGELEPGETLASATGPATLLSTTTTTRPTPVYNLEINRHHVYQVGELAVLVHNTYGSVRRATADVSTLKGRQLPGEFTGNKIKRYRRQMQAQGGYGDFPPIMIAEINGKKIIIDGHHRARAAGAAGIKKVPIEVINVPPKIAVFGDN